MSRQISACLLLLAPMGVAVAGRPVKANRPDPDQLLRTVTQARQKIVSGVIGYEVFAQPDNTPLRLRISFVGAKRLAEQFGREYAYVLMGPDAAAVTDAKIRELGLNREEAVQAGLLTEFTSDYYSAYDGSRVIPPVERSGKK